MTAATTVPPALVSKPFGLPTSRLSPATKSRPGLKLVLASPANQAACSPATDCEMTTSLPLKSVQAAPFERPKSPLIQSWEPRFTQPGPRTASPMVKYEPSGNRVLLNVARPRLSSAISCVGAEAK